MRTRRDVPLLPRCPRVYMFRVSAIRLTHQRVVQLTSRPTSTTVLGPFISPLLQRKTTSLVPETCVRFASFCPATGTGN